MPLLLLTLACAHLPSTEAGASDDVDSPVACDEPLVDTSAWPVVSIGRYALAVPPGYESSPAGTSASNSTFRGPGGSIAFREGFGIVSTLGGAALSRQCSGNVAGKEAQIYASPDRMSYAVRWPGGGLDGRDLLIAVTRAPGTPADSIALFAVPWTLHFPRR